MKPIIGMLAEVDDELSVKLQNSYVKAIERSGGIPIILPYVTDGETVKQFVELADGFCFTGGVDVEPRHYGEQTKDTCGDIQRARDELEFKVFEEVVHTNKPILAICRGIQFVNVALGGTLYQDIPTELETTMLHRQTEPKDTPSHEVNVLENTPLHELVGGANRITANSFHHQAIKTLGKGLAVMSRADDGIIEAVFGTDYP